ncbi:hypothetical protein AAFP35_21635 [Gordonia sp. CPCC 206044]|uniref:hypothetical protein n=1 Tax=Gordonia sp. CPCC 206044 TaxID=3140793 RepID=UPI003AF38E26
MHTHDRDASPRSAEPAARPAVQATAAPGFAVLQRTAGNRGVTLLVSRQVDPGKVAAIKKETEAFSTKHLGMTGDLEALWNGLGRDLPAAVNDPASRDLWRTSTITLGMDVDAASSNLRATFGADIKAATRDLATSKKTALEGLRTQLDTVSAQVQTPKDQSPRLVEDEQKAMSRIAGQRRLQVRDLIDSATMVDFLRNWDELLRTVPVGHRSAGGFAPLGTPGRPPGPGSSGTPSGTADPFGLGGGTGGPAPGSAPTGPSVAILFRPEDTRESLLRSGEVYLDETKIAVLASIHEKCARNAREFRDCADAMIREDANLAALDQAPDKSLLRAVSGLRGADDTEATSVMKRTTAANIAYLDDLLGRLPTLNWLALSVTQQMLLGGHRPAASGLDWSGLVERSFIEGYFRRRAAAEKAEAERKMYADMAIGALTFLALLSPAAPLAAGVLAAADVYAAATAIGGVADADRAAKRADDLDVAAKAGMGDDAEAKRAKKEADDKKAGVAIDLLMSLLPFLPKAAKASSAGLKSAGRFVAVSDETRAMAKALWHDTRGSIRLDVLLTGGITAAVKDPVRKAQIVDHMAARIPGNTRTTRHVWVAPALPGRPGAERWVSAGSEYGLSGYVRYHLVGPGVGHDMFPIPLAPSSANSWVNNSIEGFMRRRRAAGAHCEYVVRYTYFNGNELRPWLTRLLDTADPAVLAKLERENLVVEPFLKSAEYTIGVTAGLGTTAERSKDYSAVISVGIPPAGGRVVTRPTEIID